MLDQSNIDQLNLLQQEIPALFHTLIAIMQYEETCRFLPGDVAALVRHILKIRENLFRQAPRRRSTDYVEWEDRTKEHPTMFYPHWPIFRWPKSYLVR